MRFIHVSMKRNLYDNRMIIKKFVHRMKNMTSARTLHRWIDFVSERRAARNCIRRVMQHMNNRRLGMGFRSWISHLHKSKAITERKLYTISLNRNNMLAGIKTKYYKNWANRWMHKSQETLKLANLAQEDLDEVLCNLPNIYNFLKVGGKLSLAKSRIDRGYMENIF